MKKNKTENVSRSKYFSVIIQPKLENSEIWLDCKFDEMFINLLLNNSFPLYTKKSLEFKGDVYFTNIFDQINKLHID